jgi:membrane-bound lytic murein transglycosylase D
MQIRYFSVVFLFVTTLISLSGCSVNTLIKKEMVQDGNSNSSSTLTDSEQQQPADIATQDRSDSANEAKEINKTGSDAAKTSITSRSKQEPKAIQTLATQNTYLNTDQKLTQTKTKNLWHRLRRGFKLAIPNNKLTNHYIGLLNQNQSYLDRIQRNARPYIYFILSEAEKRGLPTELALLPAVESSYRPFAYSSGRAAGLWQFVPATGRHFKLEQNWWYDGRRDIVSSTHAAFDYLESQYKRFNGNWELALAAYNCGAGCVRKAIRKNKSEGKPTDYWSLPLPKETRAYVPKLLAISAIVKDPAKAGIKLNPVLNKPYFAPVDIGSQLDLALAADMAGLTTDDIYRLNPGLNRWATAPDGPHRLNIPITKIDNFKQELAKLDPSQRIHWKRYKIRSGDTVSTIAKKFGTTSKLIRQTNTLKGSSIRAGKYLIIPTATKSLEHYGLASDKRKQRIQNRKRKGNKLFHIVKAGDNFWDLSREYKVSHKKLAKWNGMAPGDTLKLEQKLVVWVDDKTLKKYNSKLPAIMDVHPPGTRNYVYYRVRNGDSLSTIAYRFKVKVADLKKWNKISGKYLKLGQNLKLYVDVSSQSY